MTTIAPPTIVSISIEATVRGVDMRVETKPHRSGAILRVLTQCCTKLEKKFEKAQDCQISDARSFLGLRWNSSLIVYIYYQFILLGCSEIGSIRTR